MELACQNKHYTSFIQLWVYFLIHSLIIVSNKVWFSQRYVVAWWHCEIVFFDSNIWLRLSIGYFTCSIKHWKNNRCKSSYPVRKLDIGLLCSFKIWKNMFSLKNPIDKTREVILTSELY